MERLKELKTFKVILIDGSVIGIDAAYFDWEYDTNSVTFHDLRNEDKSDPFSWMGKVIAKFNMSNIIGITEWDDEE